MYLIVLLGPSAIGKTKISLELAKEINAEIINADSRKIYKYLNIGTAKNKEALKLIPHHLIDFVDPKENFNLALFQNLAFKRIKEIFNRQKNALMVGGTGLYIDAVCEAYDLPPASTDSKFREYLKKQSKDFLYEELRRIDPQVLKSIYPNDKLRIIRAIEIKKSTGKSISEFKKLPSNPLECKIIKIGLIKERKLIYQNIDSRVDEMIKNGLLEEINDLIKRSYGEVLKIKKIMGYTEFIPYFDGTYSLNEAIELFKKHTRNYAKRQITWFKKDLKVNWINLNHLEEISLIIKEIKRIIEENI